MNSDKQIYPQTTLKEVVNTLQSISAYIKSKWKFVLIFMLTGAVLGLAYSKFKKPTYTAILTFVLDEGEGMGGALGQFSGLASMVGLDIGGGSGGGIFKGDNIMELYKSRTMMVKTLLTPLNEKELLIDRYIAFNDLRKKWAETPSLKNINFKIPQEQFTVQHDSILTAVVRHINKSMLEVLKPDKKLNIIKVEVEAKDEMFAKRLSEVLVAEVNKFYSDTRTKNSTENLKILQKQTDSVKNELRAAITGTAAATDANPNINPARQVLKVPSQNRQIDVKANTAILEELVKNLEISKVSSRNNRPLIQTIDIPVLPLTKNHIGLVLGLILGTVIGGILATIILFAKFVFRLLLK
ncbi:MAG TPA: hypothetical protein VKB19_20700 [Pedobacter sp.]|nr:hypothetical protein [Pedobacter sp.]